MARGHAAMKGYTYSTTVNIDVDVDIDQNDLSDDDLLEICKGRGLLTSGIPEGAIEELYVLLKQGKNNAALQRVQQIVQDAKGVIL
jgi:hypothetical protein